MRRGDRSPSTITQASARGVRGRVVAEVRVTEHAGVVTSFAIADELLVARIVAELAPIRALELPGVLRVLDVRAQPGELQIVREREPGCDLAALVAAGPLAIDRFATVALGLTTALAQVHARGLVHGDLHPGNAFFDADAQRVVLGPPGVAGLLAQQRAGPDSRGDRAAYLAPEVDARLRPVSDLRSDLYALGSCFYTLLSGRRPYAGSRPAIRRAQSIRLPRPIPGLPVTLAAILAKLLAARSNERYGSTAGLLDDLRRFADAWASGDRAPEFEIGSSDRPARLLAPSEPIGRESALRALARELVDAHGSKTRRVVVLHGPAGIGKTAVLEAFEELAGVRDGLFGAGRCEPGRPPMAALLDALAMVGEELVGRSAHERWGEHLRERLGGVAGVIGELIPSLAPLLGELDPVAELEPPAARRRLELALRRLLAALGERAALALALDDVDALAAEELAVVELLVDSGAPLLLILAGVAAPGPGHPAAGLLERLREDGQPALELGLGPLARADIEALVRELFAREAAEFAAVEGLVGVLERRSGGIAGLVWRCATELERHGLIVNGSLGWSWDVAALEHAPLELDDEAWVAAALAGPGGEPEDAAVLERAAWLGERFTIAALALATERSLASLVAALARLVRAGLLVERGPELEFAWGVRSVMLARCVDPAQRGAARLAVIAARERLAAPTLTLAGAIVEVEVEALAQLSAERRARLASVCVAGGRLALARGLWEFAGEQFALARALDDREPEAELVCDHAVALACAGQRELADASFTDMLERARPLERYASVAARHLRALHWEGRHAEAVALGVVALARCGVTISTAPSKAALALALTRGWLACRGLTLANLVERPAADVDDEAALVIADALGDSAFLHEPRLFVLLAALRAERAARIGRHRAAPLALANFALVVATALRRPEAAGDLCDLALELCAEVRDGDATLGRVHSCGVLVVWPLARSLASCVDQLVDCERAAVEVGDLAAAGSIATAGVGLGFHAGVSLVELQRIGRGWRVELERWMTDADLAVIGTRLELVALLAEPGRDPASIADPWTLEHARIGDAIRCSLAIDAALTSWLLGGREAAAALLDPLVGQLERRLFGSWQVPLGAVTLALLANEQAGAGLLEPREAKARIRPLLALAQRFARASWANFGVHVELIRGELERARGRAARVLLAYERARELALDCDNPCMQALACERLAGFALANGQRATARGAAITAIAALRRWGAEAAARRIEGDYAELLAVVAPAARSIAGLGRSATPSFDASPVVGAMHRISEALELEQVVARTIASALASADERALMLLEQDGAVAVVGEGQGGEVSPCEPAIPLAAAGERVPVAVVEHALETGAPVVIDDASSDSRFLGDPYLATIGASSLVCMPITRNAERIGALLVENRLAPGAFAAQRIEVLRVLLAQAASAIGHARVHEALQRSEVLFRSLVDGVPDMISLMDRDGRIEFINHLDGFELDPARLVGLDSTVIMDPSCGPQWRAALEHVAATGEARELEVRVSLPGGAARWYLVRLAGLRYGGRIAKLISISTNISERKAAEQDRLRLEAQLRQQQRLESVGTLASGVAHEINNPIQGIMNYADLILSRADDRELVTDFACEILTESERVATIVRNLLAFSRQEAEQQLEAADVQRLIQATLSLIHAVIRKDDITLEVDVPEGLDGVRCRFQQIQQIVMNLVANARDALNERFREPGGRKVIAIRARNLTREGRRWVRISVEDCGGGIPEPIRARIFDPFFTTKGRDQGTGLGLAVSHGIAVEHGGDLWVESEVGVGTTFHLELPAVDSPHASDVD